jgi:hypothetical protein
LCARAAGQLELRLGRCMFEQGNATLSTNTQGPYRAPTPAKRAILAARAALFSWPGLALLFGLALRLSRYLANQSLYVDEASLALNVLWRNFPGLAAPLDHDQAAPIGFLFSVKASSILFGASEYALRLVPLLAGLASVVLFYFLARRILASSPALCAVLLFAACWLPANYSHFVKQYSTDVAVTVAILLVAVTLPPEAARRRAAAIGLALLGSLATWFSHPAVLVLAGVGTVWFARDWKRERRLSWGLHVLVPAIWVASTLIQYWLVLRFAARNQYLLDFWRDGFMPFPPASASDWLWYPKAFADLFAGIDGTPAGLYAAGVTGLLALFGCLFLWRNNNRFLLSVMLMPIAVTLAASALRKYPFAHRLTIFLYPICILLVSAGFGWVLRRFHLTMPVAVMLAAVVVGPPLAKAGYGLWKQPGTQEVKPLFRLVADNYRKGDLVWVDSSASQVYYYYRDFAGWFPRFAFRNVCAEDCHQRQSDPAAFDAALANVAGNARIWVLAAYNSDSARDEERILLERLDQRGSRLSRVIDDGAAVTLYAFRR